MAVSKLGIEETLEIFDAIDVVIAAYEKAMDDGDIDLWDLPKLAKVIGPLKKAVGDISRVKLELKDMDEDELRVTLERCVKLALVLARAFGGKEDV